VNALRLAQERSLALHRAIVARLFDDPEIVVIGSQAILGRKGHPLADSPSLPR